MFVYTVLLLQPETHGLLKDLREQQRQVLQVWADRGYVPRWVPTALLVLC
jgi:hypothetical protein